MDPKQRVIDNFEASLTTISNAIDELAEPITVAARHMTDALIGDKKILVCGNGGSAADAQHFSAEMLNRFEAERPGLPAIALTTDSSTLTAIANDYRYEDIYAKQVLALGKPGDVLVVFTTSGNSANILRSVEAAHAREMRCVAVNGRDGGELTTLLTDNDVNLCVQGPSTARIQEVHGIVLHCFCDLIDHHLLGQN